MAGTNLNDTNVKTNLQIEYGRRTRDQLNRRTALWNRMAKAEARMEGLVHKDFAVIDLPGAGGAIGFERPLPSADTTKTKVISLYDCFLVYPISISWATISKASGQASFVPQLTMEMTNLRRAAELDFERMLFGDGSGRLAYMTAAVSTTGGTLNAATAGNWYVEAPDWMGTNIRRGNRIVFYSGSITTTATVSVQSDITSTSTLRGVPSQTGYYTVAAVQRRTGLDSGVNDLDTTETDKCAIKLTEAAPSGHGIGHGDIIVKHTAVIQDAVSAGTHAGTEFMGLRAVIGSSAPPLLTQTFDTYPASSTFEGIDPTSDTWFKSMEIAASGAELDDTHFDQLAERYENESPIMPEEIDEYWANPRQKRILLRSKYGGVRISVTGSDSPNMPVGAAESMAEKKYLMVNGKPFKTHRMCNLPDVYAVKYEHFKKYINREMSFEKPELGMGGWHQNFDRLPNSDNEMWGLAQTGTDCRSALGLISGCAVT